MIFNPHMPFEKLLAFSFACFCIALFVVVFDGKILSRNLFAMNNSFAYVFYVADKYYLCYALVNADRLMSTLHLNRSIDVVLLIIEGVEIDLFCIQKCFDSRLKVIRVEKAPTLAENRYYEQCYVRFEAFRLLNYSRIVILDADGIVLKNMDHLLCPLAIRDVDMSSLKCQSVS